MNSALAEPIPVPDPASAPYWEGLKNGKLMLCRCDDTGKWIHPPLERSRYTGGPVHFEEVSGDGTIFSYIVVRQALLRKSQEARKEYLATITRDRRIHRQRLTARRGVEKKALLTAIKHQQKLTKPKAAVYLDNDVQTKSDHAAAGKAHDSINGFADGAPLAANAAMASQNVGAASVETLRSGVHMNSRARSRLPRAASTACLTRS